MKDPECKLSDSPHGRLWRRRCSLPPRSLRSRRPETDTVLGMKTITDEDHSFTAAPVQCVLVDLRGLGLQDLREKPEVTPWSGVWELGCPEEADLRKHLKVLRRTIASDVFLSVRFFGQSEWMCWVLRYLSSLVQLAWWKVKKWQEGCWVHSSWQCSTSGE